MFTKTLLHGSCCLASLALSTMAIAQDTAPNEADQVQDIIVTAQKYSQSVNNVPMTITVATGDQLRQSGIRDVNDLPRIAPGFKISRSSTGTTIYTLRGIGYNDSSVGTRPAVTVYVDEAPIPFAVETRGAGLDAERVEILKGPQGTLFGSNSTGGAINYIAGKPTDTLRAGASITYGRFGQLDLSGFVSGPISETLSLRLAVAHEGGDDWQKSVSRPGDSAGQTDFSNGRISLLWQPSERLRMLLTAQHWVDRSDATLLQATAVTPRVPALLPATGLLGYPARPRGARWADWDATRDLQKNNRFTMLTGRIDYELSDAVTLTSLTTYNDLKYHFPGEADGVPTRSTSFNIDATSETFAQEARIAATMDRLRFIIGANYQQDRPSENNLQSIGDTTSAIAFSSRYGGAWDTARVLSRQRAKGHALFGNVEFELTPGLTLQGGLRYTKFTNRYTGCLADAGDGNAAVPYTNLINATRAARGLPPIAPLQPGACITMDPVSFTPGLAHFTLDEDNLSWRAGMQFKSTDDIMLYANVSKGYKAGGYGSINATFSTALRPVTQESVLGYEAGYKLRLMNRAVQLNGALFYYDYRDKQLIGTFINPILGAVNGLINVPKSRVYGAEVQLTATPVAGLTLDAAGSYIESEILGHYTDVNKLGQVQDFHKTRISDVPRWQVNGGARYQWAASDRFDMFLGATMTYQSMVFSELGELPGISSGGYTLVDASIGVEGPESRWRAYLWGRNLFNENYAINHRLAIDTQTVLKGRPVTYGVTLDFKY